MPELSQYQIANCAWKYATPSGSPIANTSDVALAAASTGKCHYLCSIQVFNADADTDTVVVVKDGSTVIWTGYVEKVSGKIAAAFPLPIKGTSGTALNFACITTGTTTYVSAQGYTI
jgi:hypothetical protein